jgi:hypothetical protein
VFPSRNAHYPIGRWLGGTIACNNAIDLQINLPALREADPPHTHLLVAGL